jgi:AAA domain/DnaB-like helicase N terminal domain
MTLTLSTSIDAEEGIVGACLISSQAVDVASRTVTPGDFGSPNLANTFDAIIRLHANGSAADAMTVEHQLRSMGLEWPECGVDFIRWQASVPSLAHVGHYAELVTRYSAKRRLRQVGSALANAATDPTTDPAELAEAAVSNIANIDSPALGQSPGDLTFDEFLALPEAEMAPVVIPDLLTLDDRCVIVAPEGIGKSELTRQMVVLPTWGIHPFTFRPCPAIPTLLVDLENPNRIVRKRLDYLTAQCRKMDRHDRASGSLWHRPGGIDLRKRVDRLAFEDVLRRRRPVLVALGPLYKAYGRKATESDEQVAAEVQTILDDLRTRFGFALLLEHHAPHSPSATVRELRPMGSSLWLRWPEFGLKLVPHKSDPNNVLEIGRWRGDRVQADWPAALVKSRPWPWEPTEIEGGM